MIETRRERQRFRFGVFELDAESGELFREGTTQPRLRDQALQILQMLLERPRGLVTRNDSAIAYGRLTLSSILITV